MKKKIQWSSSEPPLDELIGKSPEFASLREQIRKIAPTQLPILIQGEPGTGKRVIAQAIHKLSGRSGPFVSVNLAGIPPSLASAELFGFVRGAFTGAISDKTGLIERASSGTLYLDEIESASTEVQPLLVRFLSTSTVLPVGGNAERPVDVRIIASTTSINRKTTLRADLVNRLSGFVIEVPPLRARKEDIPLLVDRFLSQTGSNLKLSDDAMKSLMDFAFPGNIRELYNIIQRAAILAKGDTNLVEAGDLMIGQRKFTEVKKGDDNVRQDLTNLQRALETLKRSSLVANPIWEGRSFPTEVDYCFVLMPFAEADDIQQVYQNHLKPVIERRCALRCERADDIHDISGVMQSVWESINRSRIIIAEMTGRNPNVFYELGIAHTLGKPVIMITQSMDFVPFDLKHLRCIVYDYKPGRIGKFEDSLEKTVKRVLSSTLSWPTTELRQD